MDCVVDTQLELCNKVGYTVVTLLGTGNLVFKCRSFRV